MALSSPIVNDSDLWAAGPDAAFGTYPKLWNYTGPHLTKRSAEFVEAYRKKYSAPPEVEGWQDWFGATAILTAIKETKSTDSAKLVAFLEEHKFDGYKDASIGFRNFDHQLVQPLLVASVKEKITDKYDYFNIDNEYPKGPRPARRGVRQPSRHRLSIQELIQILARLTGATAKGVAPILL